MRFEEVSLLASNLTNCPPPAKPNDIWTCWFTKILVMANIITMKFLPFRPNQSIFIPGGSRFPRWRSRYLVSHPPNLTRIGAQPVDEWPYWTWLLLVGRGSLAGVSHRAYGSLNSWSSKARSWFSNNHTGYYSPKHDQNIDPILQVWLRLGRFS